MAVSSRRFVLLGVCLLLPLGVAGWYFLRPGPGVAPQPAGPTPVPPLSSSPYRNTGPEAKYVGSAACVRCHEAEHASYHRTGMSRATALVDPAKEPAGGVFAHAASGRSYETVRRDGQLRHREVHPGAEPPIVYNDLPLAFAVGSGRHAKTYLVEADGFLVESPLSWYASRQWAMSPGYDQPIHMGFERPIGSQCLFCHVGQFQIEGESFHRYRITESGIGCERCHGPGSLHVGERDRGLPVAPGGDLTIVNPIRLSRELGEAVCQQCHLAGDLTVPARGRQMTDFRPGLPLQDIHHVYRLADDDHGMTVTGHVEQLHASACYQKSGTLRCTTCHNPHGFPERGKEVAHYRAVCLSCHAVAACKVDPTRRQRESPDNACTKCHMPTNSTDIPHVAFSHHRIAVHGAAAEYKRSLPPVDLAAGKEAIRPFHDLSRFPLVDQNRSLGLAYARAGAHREVAHAVQAYNVRARDLLTSVWDTGVRDGTTAATLAGVAYRVGGDPREYAEAALTDPGLGGQERCDALFLIGDDQFKLGNYEAAAETLKRLIRLRRNATDWSYLAKTELALGRQSEALARMEQAARIGSSVPRFRLELAGWYEQLGDREAAARHRRYAPGKP